MASGLDSGKRYKLWLTDEVPPSSCVYEKGSRRTMQWTSAKQLLQLAEKLWKSPEPQSVTARDESKV
jgi:hypothetical protein